MNYLALFLLPLCLAACSSSSSDDKPDNQADERVELRSVSYTNPVCAKDLPDPTVLRAERNKFFVVSTQSSSYHNEVPVMFSPDMVNWTHYKPAFTDYPGFVAGAGVWAPDISRIGDKYIMHYSMSTWGGIDTCGIGIATSDNAYGPYIDRGKFFISSEIGVRNSIDPFFFDDGGDKYLVWGSFYGIYMIRLAEDGRSFADGPSSKVKIAGTAFEASYIHKHDGYYYYFGSAGSCCNGAKSTYRIVVGRSENLLGPYVNKKGERLLDNKYEVLLRGDNKFFGPGHNSEIITDDAGVDWIMYHSYMDGMVEVGRMLMLDRVDWVEGWPVIGNGTPSRSGDGPSFFVSK